MSLESLEDSFDYDKALVFGIGGGGDVVGSVPTARFLEDHGVDTILGGIAWERVPYDDEPGPRNFDEIEDLEVLSQSVALGTSDTKTDDGMVFTESKVAEFYSGEVALIDIDTGPEGTAQGIDEACEELGIDLVVGVDAGGDVLAVGHEDGLRSPLADGIGLVALQRLDTDSFLGVFGAGSDGELTRAELADGVKRAAERGGLLGSWGLTRRTVSEMEKLLDVIGTTEASRLPVEAARGKLGETEIRDGDRSVTLTPASTLTFYFDVSTVAATSEIAQLVADSPSLEAAHQALLEAGLETEFEVERSRLDSSGGSAAG